MCVGRVYMSKGFLAMKGEGGWEGLGGGGGAVLMAII